MSRARAAFVRPSCCVVAGVPVWQEDPRTVAAALASCRDLAAAFSYTDEHPLGSPACMWKSQAAMRDYGRARARIMYGADWYVQLDADERLHNAAALVRILEDFPGFCYPIPYIDGEGRGAIVPARVIRADSCRIVALSDHVEHHGKVYELSGYELPFEHVPNGLPWILHDPALRPNAGEHRRLSPLEHVWLQTGVEPRPANAVRLPVMDWLHRARTKGEPMEGSDSRLAAIVSRVEQLSKDAEQIVAAFTDAVAELANHSRTLTQAVEPDATLTEAAPVAAAPASPDAGNGDSEAPSFYCPGCGRRYETAGACTGSAESPHEPVQVEPLPANADESGVETPA